MPSCFVPLLDKKKMKRSPFRRLCLVTGICIGAAHAGHQAGISEHDYFSDLPEVLTVTRLAQPLAETPGAVTIIDRETIRRSGARDLADLMRLVPGYIVGGFNGAHQTVAYHVPLDDFGIRNLVLIDGRSVYSSFHLGGTNHGMATVMLEDIERIEVLRGSNSAAYGANAMFGVINVITRHAADTRGAEVSVTNGERGIRDNRARIGWGNENASFRLSAGHQEDDGYKNSYDDRRLGQFHFRGDLRPAADQELRLAAGATDATLGNGEPGAAGNPERNTGRHSFYLQAEWRRQLGATDELRLMASYDQEEYRDKSIYAPDPSVTLDFGGRARRGHMELQHTVGISPSLRGVWGLGLQHEDVRSPPLYFTRNAVSAGEQRLFGNLEWRPHARWLINAGGLWGRHSWSGEYFSPRLMANFHATPNQTLRIGASHAVRTPTLFELASDVRYFPKSLTAPPPLNVFAFFGMPYRLYAADGRVGAEKLYTEEVGYFGNFQEWHLTVDVRGYIERFERMITDGARIVPGYNSPLAPFAPLPVGNFENAPGFKVHGIEYQLRWKPREGTEIWVNQAFSRLKWDAQADSDDTNMPPTHASTVALFQQLPYQLYLTLMYHTTGTLTWGNHGETLPNRQRLDARLAWPFRVGTTRFEAALSVQAAEGEYPEHFLGKNRLFQRRAFGTLRLEF